MIIKMTDYEKKKEEQANSTKQAEANFFEGMIYDDCCFGLAVATMSDEIIIKLHDYLVIQEIRESDLENADKARLDRMHYMISKLEDIDVVEKHIEELLEKKKEERLALKEENKKRIVKAHKKLHDILNKRK